MGAFKWPALFAAVVSLLFAFVMDPHVTTEPMKIKPPADPDGTIIKAGNFDRLTFSVDVEGDKLHCWLFSPVHAWRDKLPPPVVVAAYGLGVQKDIAMVPLATSLAAEGFAVVLFDYRHWGVSGGLPRHVADPNKEVEDLQAVLQHIQDTHGLQGRVDPNRMALYGASLGGGIALATASLLNLEKNPLKEKVKAVVAAIPFVSGRAAQAAALERRGFFDSVRILGAVVQDFFWSHLNSTDAVYLNLSSPQKTGGLSVMQLEYPEYDIWVSRTPLAGKKADGAWENKLAARTLQKISRFQPDQFAVDHLDVPALVIAGSNDTICPIEPIRRMVEAHAQKQARQKLTLKEFPLRHFEFLTSQIFPVLVQTTSAFLKEHL